MSNKDMPAAGFSRNVLEIDGKACYGFTKRESFIKSILQGMCANPNLMGKFDMAEISAGIEGGASFVDAAYALADKALEVADDG